MRTPGHDEELALGFCLSEGLRPESAAPPADLAANTIDVVAPGFDPTGLARSFYTTSSCGVCGKGALEAVAVEAPKVESALKAARLAAHVAARPAPRGAGRVRRHGRAACERPVRRGGNSSCVREDVGRHNALDKVVGCAFSTDGCPLAESVICLSGRIAFELVQKAAVAGCPIVVAVGAPSSLAVELGRDRGITLCGFARDGRMNVYSEPWRVEG